MLQPEGKLNFEQRQAAQIIIDLAFADNNYAKGGR